MVFDFGGAARPHLLFDASALEGISRLLPDGGARIRQMGDGLLLTDPERIHQVVVSWSSIEAWQVAEAFVLTGNDVYATWVRRRLHALVQQETWMFHMHKTSCPHCDHVMANVGGGIAYAHDLLGLAAGEELTSALEVGMQRLLFEPFLAESKSAGAFWAHPKARSNWKIMTAGDAGLAMVALGGQWEQQREGIEAAVEFVRQTLDFVGEKGDWFEGPCYWFGTLALGLRFIVALERATSGVFNLSSHPTLQRTGGFAALSTTPAGRLHPFGDNWADPNFAPGSMAPTGILLSALLPDRRDWLGVARNFNDGTLLWAALDDGTRPSEMPSELTASFDDPGTASLRSGWGHQDAFVGVRCGSTITAHDHMDAAAIHFEAKGVPLIIDSGCWWYGDGAHDDARKTNYDGPATIGHSTLLVDGRGQEGSKTNRILSVSNGPGWGRIVADASGAYGSRLERFIRTIVLLGDNALVIRDVVKATAPVHFEWLLQHRAEVFDEGPHSIFVKENVRMCITPLAPKPRDGYRITDSARRTLYVNYDTDGDVDVTLRHRSYSPIERSGEIEFIMLAWVGPEEPGKPWSFQGLSGDSVVHSSLHSLTVCRDGEELRVESSSY